MYLVQRLFFLQARCKLLTYLFLYEILLAVVTHYRKEILIQPTKKKIRKLSTTNWIHQLYLELISAQNINILSLLFQL